MIARRSLLAVMAAGSLVLALGACGDDDDAGTEAADESAETTDGDGTAEHEASDGGTVEESAGGDDETAAGEVVSTVFDSSVPFDDKAALIEDGESHRADHDGYVAAADRVGGITVEPTDVAVDGDTATVTYRILFGDSEAYADLTMDVSRVEGEWIVPTDAFCGFLASARTPCASAG